MEVRPSLAETRDLYFATEAETTSRDKNKVPPAEKKTWPTTVWHKIVLQQNKNNTLLTSGQGAPSLNQENSHNVLHLSWHASEADVDHLV